MVINYLDNNLSLEFDVGLQDYLFARNSNIEFLLTIAFEFKN